MASCLTGKVLLGGLVWSRGVARWFRRSLSVADPFVRVEESTTGGRCISRCVEKIERTMESNLGDEHFHEAVACGNVPNATAAWSASGFMRRKAGWQMEQNNR